MQTAFGLVGFKHLLTFKNTLFVYDRTIKVQQVGYSDFWRLESESDHRYKGFQSSTLSNEQLGHKDQSLHTVFVAEN